MNVRNAFGDSDNIPVITNPDGRVAIFRNPLPTEVFLSILSHMKFCEKKGDDFIDLDRRIRMIDT